MENEEFQQYTEAPVVQAAPQAVPAPAAEEPRENVIAGTVGAFLFALAGGVCWFLLSRVGFVAAVSGLIGVVCAIKGYSVFGKKESIKGIVISVIVALLVLVGAWYLSFAADVLEAYKDWYANGEVGFIPTYADCVRNGYMFFEEGEIAGEYIKNLLFGIGFAALGSFGTISAHVKAAKAAKNAGAAVPVTPTVQAEAPTVTVTCPHCGARVDPNAGAFCIYCGQKVK